MDVVIFYYLFIFTDGSKNEQGTGAAAIVDANTLSRKFPDGISTYSTELEAIKLGLNNIQQNTEWTHSGTRLL